MQAMWYKYKLNICKGFHYACFDLESDSSDPRLVVLDTDAEDETEANT